MVASRTFIYLLASIGISNFQAFPAQLINPETGEKRDDYFLFNILGFMKVSNLEASEYDELMMCNPDSIDVPLPTFIIVSINGNQIQNIDLPTNLD